MSEWSSHQQELSRKSVEVLEQRLHKVSTAEITEREFQLIADALYDAVTGLIDWDIANIIYEARGGTDGPASRS